MLAEWPDTVSERAFNESAAAMAEHAVQQQFDKLSHLEVSAMIASAVSKTAVTFGEFKTMQLTESVISRIKALNADRGYKKKPYSWDHLLAYGYRGTFFKFSPGETPVMKAAECMDYLSLLYCLMLNKKA